MARTGRADAHAQSCGRASESLARFVLVHVARVDVDQMQLVPLERGDARHVIGPQNAALAVAERTVGAAQIVAQHRSVD
jgi:hypothetical protein